MNQFEWEHRNVSDDGLGAFRGTVSVLILYAAVGSAWLGWILVAGWLLRRTTRIEHLALGIMAAVALMLFVKLRRSRKLLRESEHREFSLKVDKQDLWGLVRLREQQLAIEVERNGSRENGPKLSH